MKPVLVYMYILYIYIIALHLFRDYTGTLLASIIIFTCVQMAQQSQILLYLTGI